MERMRLSQACCLQVRLLALPFTVQIDSVLTPFLIWSFLEDVARSQLRKPIKLVKARLIYCQMQVKSPLQSLTSSDTLRVLNQPPKFELPCKKLCKNTLQSLEDKTTSRLDANNFKKTQRDCHILVLKTVAQSGTQIWSRQWNSKT